MKIRVKTKPAGLAGHKATVPIHVDACASSLQCYQVITSHTHICSQLYNHCMHTFILCTIKQCALGSSTVCRCAGSCKADLNSEPVTGDEWKMMGGWCMQIGGTVPAFKWSEEGVLVHPATPPRSRMLGALHSHLQRQGSSAGQSGTPQQPNRMHHLHPHLLRTTCTRSCIVEDLYEISKADL